MISYDEAVTYIKKNSNSQLTEKLSLLAALGKISASDIVSNMAVPSFRNSAMDGFAVKAADLVVAGMALHFTQAIAAGDVAENNYGQCVQIMTGAPVPDIYDAVIPVEYTTISKDKVTFNRPAKQHENIRNIGEDIEVGAAVLKIGDVISAEKIMLLAALGIAEIVVYKLPNIHIISTGKEIIDDTNTPLSDGKIYNSNAPYLLARCAQEGFVANYGGIIADDATAFEKRISQIPSGSVIITTGAVSKGAWDFIPESLNNLGAETLFHRVNIRPGKPVLFARLPNGSWFFGLPGNPISAAIGFRFFVQPLMRYLQGLAPEKPIKAKLATNFTKKGNFCQFLKATITNNNSAEIIADISSGQESFKISPMAEANAWVMLEETQMENKIGNIVAVFPFKNGNKL
jgi:molybdopterin molybdotransferase